ncbi:P-II family nitrogen regulator [Clostridiaceae bacterium UIB06]|uniref:P-II family nitrogen regulator n=1 Tax=Clostridium thailandense TaxID=2794346 RepID=A0A949TWF5_9CLOT|nr:P-II family nitrogen regulator [Clostridium thailandense]MBV7273728.1 P-II family nitrogen regulator [Clostridium thailandense]MCH5137492.1 P-II family nitrogen regulator [Clostridiaceae bacterium UIB06]
MKEVVAIIRMNMVNKTKAALLEAGFPFFTCRKVMGRGKKKVDFVMIEDALIGEIVDKGVAEQASEAYRLISKRMIILLVKDEDVDKVVNEIIKVNSTGNPGDGKIFITNVIDVARIRTGERGEAAI